ncbi:UDP-4-amino-4,6-dideoxy-N-acetyl-beta-L-altrosamine transaminase [Sporolactobacillus putidus]|uniref:UDP-4-amino-4, 6-dideoxy-N-acetyl-beta-L-altrosamine transaminase n=1 Tax=Sporolactobacillus putidus TaxID=492735 RepID=A0A917W0Q4_9BACL|nr:UDP-4-amino-4,6-dideoxy-N-acetyl-beta-L-altrosamine transaminase [Sporolactobacillus putidus]GGL54478.1 UDP-4-amino-4,6-dideoxy-N-acetyl-beta-L-altrosamine transaminase [Sporolactobacillus putidus]
MQKVQWKPIRNTFLPYARQWIDDADIQAVTDVLQSDYLTTGPKIKEFEQAIAQFVGAKYAVSFANGTAALHGACFAAGIHKGDEVICTPMTFAASSNCVLYCGGNPVFADIDSRTYNMDPAEIEKKITARTKAIIPVDYTGQPAQLDEIMALARKHHLTVIEDGAHSLGSHYKGKKVGSISDMTMFSFHPVKQITSGEGGMITTNEEAYYEKLLQFRSHGITRDAKYLEKCDGPWYYEMQFLGYNYRMTDIQAVLGISQLSKIEKFIDARKQIVERYNEAFQAIPELTVPYQHPDTDSSWHLYILRLKTDKINADRREIFEALRAQNIGVNVHYLPVYLHPYYRELGYERGLCPNAEKHYDEIITLPLFPKMTEQDVRDVIQAVTGTISYLAK